MLEACRSKIQESIAMQNIANWYLHRNNFEGNKEILTVEQQEIVDGLLKKYREDHNSPLDKQQQKKDEELAVSIASYAVASKDDTLRQPDPKPNDTVPIWDLVIKDMQARDHVGRKRYGTPLQANNGRDALQDAYEEALDLTVYLRQVIEERKG